MRVACKQGNASTPRHAYCTGLYRVFSRKNIHGNRLVYVIEYAQKKETQAAKLSSTSELQTLQLLTV